MQPTQTPQQIGAELAHEHAKILRSVHRGALLKSVSSFVHMPVDVLAQTVEPYVKTLIGLSDTQESLLHSDVKHLIVEHFRQLLTHPHLEMFIRTQRVREIVEAFSATWASETEPHISAYAVRDYNEVFQGTQNNYAEKKGLQEALNGFRLVGQTHQGAPFLLADPVGVASIPLRLAFFLQLMTDGNGALMNIEVDGQAMQDLIWCWRHCKNSVHGAITENMFNAHEEKRLRAVFKAGNILETLYPDIMRDEIRSWSNEHIDLFRKYGQKYGHEGATLSLIKQTSLMRLTQHSNTAPPPAYKPAL